MTGRWRRSAVALLVLAIATAGCSGDGESDDGGQSDGGGPPQATVRVVSQNLLHGIACPPASERCALAGRVALFVRQLDEQGCPDLVGVQEANERTVALLREELPRVCAGAYTIVWDDDPGLDREVVLTTLPVLGWRRTQLAGPLRTALWVRVAGDVGVVDFVTSHLASSSDDRPCDRATCPAPCSLDTTVQVCQAEQLVAFAEEVAAADAVVVIAGDLNARADETAIEAVRAGGFIDTHLAAGNPECDPASGAHCTSGRADDSLADLTDPSSRQSVRIDYVFVGGRRTCRTVPPTGLFNAEPAPSPVDGLLFPADHTAVEATLQCATTSAQRDAAASATVPSVATTVATTATASRRPADPETVEAITAAFAAVFNGDITDVDVKLASLEDGELLRAYFVEAFEATREIAARVRVRIDDVVLVDPTHADVTYTLLLDGAAVLDHLSGGAVQINGRWQVSRRTYCDVSTQGAAEIPPPCR